MLDIPTAFGMLIFFINFKSYGISGQIVSLFSPFLSNRRFEVILDGKSSQEYPVNDGVLKGSVIGHTLFIYDIAIYADEATDVLHSKCDQAFDLWQQLELASELESDLWDTVDLGKKWLVNFYC